MSALQGLLKKLRVLTHKRRTEQELDEELAIHVDMETEKNIRDGMPPAEARRAALLAFGGVERTKERVRDARWARWIEDCASDIRYAVKSLAKSRGFAAAAVATLAIGVGANTAVFSVVEALFLRAPSGIVDPGQVVRLYVVRDEGMVQTPTGAGGSYVDFRGIRDGVPGLSEVAAFMSAEDLDLGLGSQARRVRGRAVSNGFLPLLGVRMAEGRAFTPEEDGAVADGPVAVISYHLWRDQFGGDRSIIGRSIVINGRAWAVVGVTDPDFNGIEPQGVDIWVPMGVFMDARDPNWREWPFSASVRLIGRRVPDAAPSVIIEQATAVLTEQARATHELDPTPHVVIGSLLPTSGPRHLKAAQLALWLWAVAGMILVVGCANLVNLFLARATKRRREMASRLALGATTGRLARQIFAESLVLSVLGAMAGLLVAVGASTIMRHFPIPPSAAALHARPMAFALAAALVAGAIPAIMPVLYATGSDPGRWLSTSRTASSPKRGRVRNALVGVQVALSAVLMVGAGLFIRSLSRVYAVDPGLDVERLLVVTMDLERSGYEIADREAIYAAAESRLRDLPGVEQVALVLFAPLDGLPYGMGAEVLGHDSLGLTPRVNWVGARYFETIGTSVLQGRGVGDEAGRGQEIVAVVNHTLARELTPSGQALGMCLVVVRGVPNGQCARVVGIVDDQRTTYLDAGIEPTIYFPRAQNPDAFSLSRTHILVRSADPGAIVRRVRETLQALRPDLPYISIETLNSRVRPELLTFRLGAVLFSAFGLLAVSIAALGLHGVLGYFVSERAPELGIRRSLGARDTEVLQLVIGQSVPPVAMGIAVGLATAYAGGRLLESLLFGVSGHDPAVFLVAAVLLGGVALVASWAPARRGAKVDPMTVLRIE